MILVDINKEKEIKYSVPNISLVKSACMIILFENNVEMKYNGLIDENNKEVIISLPVFKDFVKNNSECKCYLELEDINGIFYNMSNDSILFQNVPLIELKFHETEKIEDVSLKSKPEIVSGKTTVIKNVSYKKNNKPPKRTEILNIYL